MGLVDADTGTVTGDDVRRAEFHAALMGYRARDVDDKLSDLADALDDGLSLDALLADATFATALRGYRCEEVDRLLEQVRSAHLHSVEGSDAR